MPLRNLILLCLVSSFTLLVPAMVQAQDPIARVQADLTQRREALEKTEDKAIRSELLGEIEQLDTELEDLILEKRRVQLAEREAHFEKQLRGNSEYALREALRAVDSDAETPGREARRRAADARQLRARRALQEERLAALLREGDPKGQAIRELKQDVGNKNEEILARSLERDLAELQASLAEHANRIDEFTRSLPVNPHPTIGMILERRRYTQGERDMGDDMETRLKDLEQQRAEVAEALELSRERRTILQKSEGGLFRSSMEKKVGEKVELQAAQLVALDATIGVLGQAQDLFAKEVAYFEDRLELLVERYWQRLLLPIGVILGLIALHVMISRMVLPRLYERDTLFVARRLGSYSIVLLAILVLAVFFLEDLRAIATVMGIAGAAVVIALQDLCSSFAGCFVIITSRKFQVGNRVEIDNHRGDVIDIQLLRTTLLELHNWLGVDEPTGRIIIIPNSFIFKSNVINYSHVHPYIWGRIDITVTFETPAEEAHDLLMKVLEEETRDEFEEAQQAATSMIEHYGVQDTLYRPKIYSIIADSGVLFGLLYVCHYKRFSTVRNKVNKRIITEFNASPRLEFAYPTERHIPTPAGPAFPVKVEKS